MQKKRFSRRGLRSSMWRLALLYMAAAALRFGLSLALSNNPFIAPDELLYHNIAKSILAQGSILVRGQPAVYESLFYPLLLIPLYLLPGSFDMFRAIQLFNILLMTSAVFPGFLLARRLLGKESHAWICVCLILLMPDMALAQLMISESVCYPLLFWMLYLAYRAFDGAFGWKDAIAVSALGALLYFAKPGLVAVPAAFCVTFVLFAVKSKSRKQLCNAVVTLTMLAAFVAGIQLLCRFGFHVDSTKTSIYGEQFAELTSANLLVVVQGVVLYLYFFPVAASIIPALLPFSGMGRMTGGKRYFTAMMLLLLLATILGVSYVIFLYEWKGTPFAGRIHMRYLAAYIPVLVMLSLSDELMNMKRSRSLLICMSLLFAATIALTPGASTFSGQERMDALTLSIFATDWFGISTKTVAQILLISGIPAAALVLWRWGWTRSVRRTFLGICAAMLLLNNVSAYALLHLNTDKLLADDARETARLADGQAVLYVTNNEYHSGSSYALDVRFRHPLDTVTVNDLAVSMLDSDGTYKPFFPRSYWPTYPDHDTPDAGMMILEGNLLPLLQLAPGLEATKTQNGNFALIPIQKGRPWLYSILAGHKNGIIPAKEVCTIILFAPGGQPDGGTRLRINASGSGDLIMKTDSWKGSVPLTGEAAWHEAELPLTGTKAEQIDLYCVAADVQVFAYEIVQ